MEEIRAVKIMSHLMPQKSSVRVVLVLAALLVIGLFGYLRYSEFCQPILQSDAYNRDEIERGVLVQETNPAMIQQLNASLGEYKKKRSWGEWWQEAKFSSCSKIFPPQPFALPGTPPMPTTLFPQLPPQTQTPTDTRSWGERFRDPAIPKVAGVEWQTYTNKEYGFEMEYPKGMEIEEGKRSQAGSPYTYHIYFSLPLRRPHDAFLTIIVSLKSLREIFQEDLYVVYRRKLENMTPDAIINGLDIFTENSNQSPDSNGSNALELYFEKYGHSYYLGESGHDFNNTQDYKIVEHIIKSLHFLK